MTHETITTTYALIDTAMAAYAALEDTRLIDLVTLPEDHPFKEAELAMSDWCDNFGAATMRSQSWEIAPIIEAAWCALTEEEQEDICWDFEFVPAVLLTCIKFDQNSEYLRPIVEGAEALAQAYRVAERVRSEFKTACAGPSTKKRDEFVAECKAEAVRQWAYEDLVTDDCLSRDNYTDSRMQAAFEAGEKPAEFVKWLGEKYDLTPVSQGIGSW